MKATTGNALRLLKLVNALLDFSRQTPPSMQDARLEDVLERVLRIARTQASGANSC